MTLRDFLKEACGIDSSKWVCEPEEMDYKLEILEYPTLRRYPLDLVVVYEKIKTVVVS